MLNPIIISQKSSYLDCEQHLKQLILPVKGIQPFITRCLCSKLPCGSRYSCSITTALWHKIYFPNYLSKSSYGMRSNFVLWHKVTLPTSSPVLKETSPQTVNKTHQTTMKCNLVKIPFVNSS